MSNKQLKAAGAKGRADLGKYDPADFLTVADKGHLLYKPTRLYRYDPADPEMKDLVDSVDERGVIEPVIFRLREGKCEIACGSRRVIAARAANARRLGEGRESILVPAYLRALSDAALTDLYVVENEDRKQNDPMTAIEAMSLMVEQGVPIDRVCKRFRLAEKEVKSRIDPTGILSAHKAVKGLLAKEAIDFGQARRLARLCMDAQATAAQRLADGEKFTLVIGKGEPRKMLTRADRKILLDLIGHLQQEGHGLLSTLSDGAGWKRIKGALS